MTDDQQRARERFEAWAKTEQYDICRCEEDNSRYLDKTTRQAFDAWNAALRAAPEGFVLVPVKSTNEMHKAYLDAKYDGPKPTLIPDLWAAMLAARPQGVKDAT